MGEKAGAAAAFAVDLSGTNEKNGKVTNRNRLKY